MLLNDKPKYCNKNIKFFVIIQLILEDLQLKLIDINKLKIFKLQKIYHKMKSLKNLIIDYILNNLKQKVFSVKYIIMIVIIY